MRAVLILSNLNFGWEEILKLLQVCSFFVLFVVSCIMNTWGMTIYPKDKDIYVCLG